ncbi:MAG: glutamate-1-semialdehyde 2,1-aminomutase [Lachnospirales bacterium]
MFTEKSAELFKRAIDVMPGGVNSPVRAFNSVGGVPRFIENAKAQYLYDKDGNKYIDYIGSWGPMILGHNDGRVLDAVKKQLEKGMSYGASTELEVEMAELICNIVPAVEMIRMVNSGTEAVMSAIRAARGFTGRNKVIKFEGCYHGHADLMLVKAGSGVMTAGVPDSSGVPEGCVKDTLTAIYNNIDSVKKLFDENKNEIACVIVEPVAANMGVVLPENNFLSDLRKICTENGALLILDEVITGFRLQLEGASGYFDIKPDLVTYGKIIGGGMPVGAYGGRKDVMSVVSPVGNVYQAGTLSGNPIAMRAGITQLTILKNEKEIYAKINNLGEMFRQGVKNIIDKYSLPCTVNGIGSLSTIFFTPNKVTNYDEAKKADIEAFSKFFNFMIDRGNYFGASQYEAVFISSAHSEENIAKTLSDIEEYFSK